MPKSNEALQNASDVWVSLQPSLHSPFVPRQHSPRRPSLGLAGTQALGGINEGGSALDNLISPRAGPNKKFPMEKSVSEIKFLKDKKKKTVLKTTRVKKSSEGIDASSLTPSSSSSSSSSSSNSLSYSESNPTFPSSTSTQNVSLAIPQDTPGRNRSSSSSSTSLTSDVSLDKLDDTGGGTPSPLLSSSPSLPRAGEEQVLPAKKTKRNHIINELLATEETYVRGLRYLSHGFIEGMQSAGLITPEMVACQRLFTSLRTLVSVHGNLLRDLRARIADYSEETTKVGDLLCDMLPFFKLYVEYVNYYNPCVEEVRALTLNKKTNAVISKLKATDEYEGYFGFGTLLICPIQRLPRYEMLFRDLHKNTLPTHPDYDALAKAAEGTHALSNFINDQKRKLESDHRIGQIASSLKDQKSQMMMRESVYNPNDQEMESLKTKTKPHVWKPKVWKEPIWCFLCNKICVENGKFKGMICKNCPWCVHRECSATAPNTCGLSGNESLLKHDRTLIKDIEGVEYCQVISGVNAKQMSFVEKCTLFIFNDSIVCLEPCGEGEFRLMCMVKFYSRSTCKFATVNSSLSQDRSIAINPAREAQLVHRFRFSSDELKMEMESVINDVMSEFRKLHEEQEKRRARGNRSSGRVHAPPRSTGTGAAHEGGRSEDGPKHRSATFSGPPPLVSRSSQNALVKELSGKITERGGPE
jgi:hypothetical protein